MEDIATTNCFTSSLRKAKVLAQGHKVFQRREERSQRVVRPAQ